ncbi:TetR/AcrR family transcriptional regulator [Halobacillus andaensis]|uniref:TetR/AcrR family transcriptional regulator n=1 Tax=Halobacillus andaensis TaxID=1176239 RepID=UPI003D7356A1
MPRNVERDQELRKERRGQILRASVELFATKGITVTKISDIAKKAGVSHGLVYNYFQSKEEILATLIQEELDGLKEHLQKVLKLDIDPKTKLIQVLHDWNKDKSYYTVFHQIFVDQVMISEGVSDEVRESLKKKSDEGLQLLAKIFKAGQLSGDFIDGDPKQHALFFFSLIRALILAEAREGLKSPLDEKVLIYFIKSNLSE